MNNKIIAGVVIFTVINISLGMAATEEKLKQNLMWANHLSIAEFTPDLFFCNEQTDDGESTTFGWITNFHICHNNATSRHNIYFLSVVSFS